MSKTQQIWKYSWNPSGYLEEGINISTENYSLNKELYLKHTFFASKDFIAYYMLGSVKRYLKCHETLQEDTDILFLDKENDLSSLANKNIYSKIKLISEKALNKIIYYNCNFIADALSFESFKQDLTPTSDVVHKSIKIDDINSISGYIKTLEVDEVKGSWGEITSDSSVLNSNSLELKSSSLSEQGHLITSKVPSFRYGTEFVNIKFNTANEIATISLADGKEGLLLRGPDSIDKIPVFGIPVILSDDPTKLNFVPWLSLDPENQGIKIGSININDNTFITDNKIEFCKNATSCEITLMNNPFIKYEKATGDFSMLNGILKINTLTGRVIVNGIDISENIFREFTQIQRDINYLKSKIN